MNSRPANPFTVRRPASIGRNRRQAAIVVRDASPSMEGDKAREASEAVRRFIGELAQPFNKDGFDVAVVDFNHSAGVVHPLTRASGLSVQPIATGGEGTDIAGALAQAEVLAKTATGETWIRPVVLLFTDGEHNTGGDPATVADRLRGFADLVTVAFGDDADEALLQSLATSASHFFRCTDGAQLRAFLAEVGQTMSTTRARNQDATKALGHLDSPS